LLNFSRETEKFTYVTPYWYFVIAIFCYRYSTINNSVKNNIFLRNLAIVSAIYWEVSVRNFIQSRSNLTFLLYDV